MFCGGSHLGNPTSTRKYITIKGAFHPKLPSNDLLIAEDNLKYICCSYSAVVAMFDFQPTQKVKTL